MKIETWQHCYDDSWKGLITNDAFAHPAKMARGLVRRIFDELFAMEALRKGDVVLDPFGGVGTTGIEASSRGVQAYLVELEARFARFVNGYDCPGLSKREWIRWFGRFGRNQKICPTCQGGASNWYEKDSGIVPEKSTHRYKGNFELHQEHWALLDKPRPVMFQGDSRKLRQVLLGKLAECVVSSPPYAGDSGKSDSTGHKRAERRALEKGYRQGLGCFKTSESYGQTVGQLGAMPEGRIDTVVSSPPYNLPMSQSHNGKRGGLRGTTPSEQGAFVKYGNTDRQLEGMPMGEVAAVISSPPFLATEGGCKPRMGGTIDEAMMNRHNATANDRYGTTAGQLGNMPQGSVAVVVSSPPYSANTVHGKSGINLEKFKEPNRVGVNSHAVGKYQMESYGQAAGQLGTMPAGEIDHVISPDHTKNYSTLSLCKNVKIVESKSLDAVNGVNHVVEHTSQQALLVEKNQKGMGSAYQQQDITNQRRNVTEPVIQIGKVGMIDGEGTHGEFKGAQHLIGMVGNAQNAEPVKTSKYITKKIESQQEENGTTHLKIFKPFVNHATAKSQDEDTTKTEGVESAEQTSLELSCSARIGVEMNRSEDHRNAMYFYIESKNTNAHLAIKNSNSEMVDGNIVRQNASKKAVQPMKESVEKEQSTFWEAARDIILESHAILKPGGIAVWVVKDFVRDKKRVRFSDDWIKLCEACGFKLIRHAHAMLVKKTRTQDLFGEETVKRVERKSFFRRLHEQKLPAGDERRIDHEDVVFFVKT